MSTYTCVQCTLLFWQLHLISSLIQDLNKRLYSFIQTHDSCPEHWILKSTTCISGVHTVSLEMPRKQHVLLLCNTLRVKDPLKEMSEVCPATCEHMGLDFSANGPTKAHLLYSKCFHASCSISEWILPSTTNSIWPWVVSILDSTQH